MEVKTTIVKFSLPKQWCEIKTEDSQLICVTSPDSKKEERIWLPLSKFNYEKSENDNEVKFSMPKWLFFKTNLPFYVLTREEDTVVTNI